MDNYAKTLINRMSQLTGTALTSEHLKVLEFAYDYYEKNDVGPLYQNLLKHTGTSKRDIESLFPHGLHSIYSWVGIPIQSTNDLCKPIPIIPLDEYREVYLDHNATTYIRDEVRRLLVEYDSGGLGYGNASSSTYLGKQAYDIIQTARAQIADSQKVAPKEIVFTSGGSEANNLAVKGIVFRHLEKKGRIITDRVEHPSILRTTHFLKKIGFDVQYLDVNREGRVSPQAVQDHLTDDTLLVAIMAANNEIGTINPVEEIGRSCADAHVPFMVDAVQAFGRMALQPKEMGISLLSISGHKIYGPKGVGALYVDEGISLTPLIHGGKQEHGLRAGTENVGSIAAFGEAARLITSEMPVENSRLIELRNFFLKGLEKIEPECIVNGPLDNRLPTNLNIGFPDIDSGALLLSLNQIGVYVAAGSACGAGSKEASHVIQAIGMDTDRYGTIRFSFGLKTTKEDLEYVLQYLPNILKELKNNRPS